MELYLTHIKDYKLCKAVTKFRLSSHDLNIEKDRHLKIKADERFCPFCKDNSIEDEKHALMDCHLYRDIRSHLFIQLDIYECKKDFISIMSCPKPNVIFCLSKYLHKMFKRRNLNSQNI